MLRSTAVLSIAAAAILSHSASSQACTSTTLTVAQRNGPGSLLVHVTGCFEGDRCFVAATFNPANAGPGSGTGWWVGLHISPVELFAELASNMPPFVSVLDAAGDSHFELPAGALPPALSGLVFWAVARTFDPVTSYSTGSSEVIETVLL